ncbi:MAG: alpha/beta hydrolase [Candidatus Promineifilaceae bacterium]
MKKKLLWLLAIVILFLLVGPYVIPMPAQPDLSAEAVAPGSGRFLTVDGVKTHVQDFGPRNGPAVVFIHGFGGSTYSWRETLPVLASAGYRAIALDLKGFGLSDKRFDEDYSHASQADYVAGVMDELGVAKATIAGHSMGVSVLAHFATIYPERVEKLVLVDGTMNIDSEDSNFDPLGLLLRFSPVRQWARFIMRWQLNEEQVAARLLTAYHDPAYVTPEIKAGYLAPQKIKDWELALLGIMRDSSKNSLAMPLDEVADGPILIVWGEDDTWVPLTRGNSLAESLPGAEFIIIPDSGHLPMEEQAELFNERLLDFLNQQSP